MIKVNKLTDYAILLLNYFAKAAPGQILNAAALAHEVHLPVPTVSKILKILHKKELLHSHRGAGGGYQLAKSLQYISVAELIEAMEGRLAFTDCNIKPGLCAHEDSCQIRSPWQRINQMVRDLLSQVSLADMTK